MHEYYKDLNHLLTNKEENIFIDFKEVYPFSRGKVDKSKQAEFIKDCIGFLNAEYRGNKYLVFGVTDKGDVKGVCSDDIKEEELQTLIRNHITPIPSIRIIQSYRFEDKELLVVEISSVNKYTLYSVSKALQWEDEKKHKKGLSVGDSFIRRGTQVQNLRATDAIAREIDNKSIASLIDLSAINLEKLDYILEFIDFMSNMVMNSDSLFEFIHYNVNLLKKFNSNFSEYVLAGNISNIQQVNFVDGGTNSLVDGLFYISKELYQINELFDFSIWSTVITLKHKQDIPKKKFKDLKKTVDNINLLLESYISYQYMFGNKFFFKITQIIFDEDTLNYFGESKLGFSLSDDIMKLFLEPLYARSDSFSVAIREVLQNSFDACKKNISQDSDISVKFCYENSKLTKLIVSDNGVGMNWDDIEEYFLKIGKSSKAGEDEAFIGKFGVGALSIFLIGNRAIIRSKKNGYPLCTFEVEKEDFIVRKMSNNANISSETGTTLEITIDSNHNDLTTGELIEKLHVKDYLIQDGTSLSFQFDTEEIKVPKVLTNKEDTDLFDKVSFTENTSVYILKPNQLLDTENGYSTLLKYKNKILFNNQICSVNYGHNQYIDTYNMPLIIIDGHLNSNDGFITELSREKYNITGGLLNCISSEILRKNKLRFDKDVESLITKQISILEKIYRVKELASMYHLKFKNFIFDKNNLKVKTDVNNLHKIYVNDIDDNHFESLLLEENCYVKKNIRSERSFIADIIDREQTLVISKKFYDRFIINASSSANGFRKITLENLLKAIDVEVENYRTAQELWEFINNNSTEIRNKLNAHTKNNLVYLNSEGEAIALNTREKYESNLVITKVTGKTNCEF